MSREEWLAKKRNSIKGKRYGNVVVIGYSKTIGKHSYYLCRCELCGKEFETRRDGLVNGHTTSCGCVRDKWMHSGNLNKKHGLSEDRAYWVWVKMKRRCYSPSCREYKNYGGRGIKICDEWLSPENFVRWARESGYDYEAPKGSCTLDRIDVNGDYEPGNCRWITNLEQQNNRRNNRRFDYQGVSYTVAELARMFEVPYSTMYASLVHYGMTVEHFLEQYTPRHK